MLLLSSVELGLRKLLGRVSVRVLVLVAVSLSVGGLLGRALMQGPGPQLAYRFVPGERWHYRLRYSGDGTVDLGAITSGKASGVSCAQTQSIQTVVETEVLMDVIAKDERRVLVAYSFPQSEVVLTLDAQPLPGVAEAIAADMREPVFAELDPQGRIQLLHFAPESEDGSRQLLRSLLATMQFVVPAETASAGDWEAWEDSPNGRRRAVYQADPDAEGETLGFIKTREEYEQRAAKKGRIKVETTVHPGGALQFGFDPVLGQVRTIRGSETLTVMVEDKVLSESENSLTLEFLDKVSLPELEWDRLRRLAHDREQQGAPESLVAKVSSSRSNLVAQQRELGDATLESLLADLAREESTRDPKKDQFSLYRKIAALIFVHPETSLRWGKLVNRAGPESLTMRLVPSALAAAGHEQAQAALVAALKARASDEAVALRLIPILAMLESPSELAEGTLRELALQPARQRIAASAQLGLGIMARSMKEDHPERAGKIVAWAVRELESAGSESKSHHFLLVLGNAGAPEALPAIQRFLGDHDAGVRAAAVGALRFIESDQTEALITQVLASDSEPEVRAEAVRDLGYRSVTGGAFQAAAEALRSDKSASVRLASLTMLWQCRQRFPQAISLVENTAKNDPDDRLRKRANELLGKQVTNK
jgi:HEAT repeat protein